MKPLLSDQPGPRIEEAAIGDLEAIVEIDYAITRIRKPDRWRGLLESAFRSEAKHFLIARNSDVVIGYVAGEVRAWEFGSPPCGWLYSIGVRADMRLEHIGSALFHELLRRFRRQSVLVCRTMLHVDDYLLMSFFRSQGLTAGRFLELEMQIGTNA